MGWEIALTGRVRIRSSRARQLLACPVDWSGSEQTLRDYLGRLATYDDDSSVLRFRVGWRTWKLRALMNLLAAYKDVPGTDILEHAAPTHDAWYSSGRFFVECGRWGYVGAGLMFDPKTRATIAGPFTGPADPAVEHVRTWAVVRLDESGAVREG